MQSLDFAVINRLHLPPQLPDFLFLIIVRKDFAETLERHHRAQSNQHRLSLKFFHAFCRSPHSGQSLFLSPPVAVLRTEGPIWGRFMSSHNATASCQSTSPQRTPSRNPASSLRMLHVLSVTALSLLFARGVHF